MLLLIFADGHQVGLIKQNVSRHQHRVIKHADTNIFALLPRLFFELRHPLKLRHARDAIQYPGQFGVFRNI